MKSKTFVYSAKPPASAALGVFRYLDVHADHIQNILTEIHNAACHFVTKDAFRDDWDAENQAFHALRIAIQSLDELDGSHRSKGEQVWVKDWWVSADPDARRQAIRIARRICER